MKNCLTNSEKNQSREVATVLFSKYVHLIYGVGLKYLKSPEKSKDIVMSTYEKMCLHLTSTEIRDFSSWLHQIARNECLSILQSEDKMRQEETNYAASKSYTEEPQFESKLSHTVWVEGRHLDFSEEMIAKAVRSLEPHHRRCVHHFYFDNMTYEQIAKKCRYSKSEVKSYLQNGKRKLKLLLLQQSREIIS